MLDLLFGFVPKLHACTTYYMLHGKTTSCTHAYHVLYRCIATATYHPQCLIGVSGLRETLECSRPAPLKPCTASGNTPSQLQRKSRSLASSYQPQHPGERGRESEERRGREGERKEGRGRERLYFCATHKNAWLPKQQLKVSIKEVE